MVGLGSSVEELLALVESQEGPGPVAQIARSLRDDRISDVAGLVARLEGLDPDEMVARLSRIRRIKRHRAEVVLSALSQVPVAAAELHLPDDRGDVTTTPAPLLAEAPAEPEAVEASARDYIAPVRAAVRTEALAASDAYFAALADGELDAADRIRAQRNTLDALARELAERESGSRNA